MTGPVYAQRPSKAVTRLVLVEMLQRLAGIESLAKYQYVGFGALEFVDFDLVHRRLGIRAMTSIESKPAKVDRQKANRPFAGITVLGGDALTVLPTMSWQQLSVVWLDFECMLNTNAIAIVQYMAGVLKPGSVLAVTLNAEPGRKINGRVTELENAIGPERVPNGTTGATLGDWGTAELQRDVLISEIDAVVASRRGGEDTWQQLLNIEYRDGAAMQIVAGIIGGPGMDQAITNCRFDKVDAYRPGKAALRVEVPYLTPKERRYLNERLPRAKYARLKLPGVADAEVRAYESAYRWLESTA